MTRVKTIAATKAAPTMMGNRASNGEYTGMSSHAMSSLLPTEKHHNRNDDTNNYDHTDGNQEEVGRGNYVVNRGVREEIKPRHRFTSFCERR